MILQKRPLQVSTCNIIFDCSSRTKKKYGTPTIIILWVPTILFRIKIATKKICWNKKWKKFNVPLNLKITSPPVVHLSLTLHPTYLYSLSIPLYISFPPFLFLSLPFSPPYTVKVLTLQIRVLIMLPFRVCKRNSHKANMIIDWRRRGIKHRRRKKKRLFVSKKDT